MQDDGTTALWIASANGHADVVGALVASGANVNQGRMVSGCGVVGEVKSTGLCVCVCVSVCVCVCLTSLSLAMV